MRALACISCAFVSLMSVHEATAACSEYKQPQLRNEQQFVGMDFGILAHRVPGTRNRYVAFEESGCYDMADFRHGTRFGLYINNRLPKTEATYLAASVSRTFLHEMRGQSAISVDFYRNANDTDSPGRWIRALNEEAYSEGSSIIGARFDIIPGEFQSSPAPIDTLSDLSNLNLVSGLSEMEWWHALIADVEGNAPTRSALYQVIKNTRQAMHSLNNAAPLVDQNRFRTLLTKYYLIKFNGSSEPAFDRPDLRIGWADCIYLNYRIGGTVEAPFREAGSHDHLIFRTKNGVDC